MAASYDSTSPGAAGCAPCCGCRLEPLAADAAVILASRSAARARAARAPPASPSPRSRRWSTRPACATRCTADGVPAEDAAVALAELKAAHVAARAPDAAIVLGADQLLELDGDVAREAGRSSRRPAPSCCDCAAASIAWSARWWRFAAAAASGTRSMSRGCGCARSRDAFLDDYLGCGRAEASWLASAPTSSRAWAHS